MAQEDGHMASYALSYYAPSASNLACPLAPPPLDQVAKQAVERVPRLTPSWCTGLLALLGQAAGTPARRVRRNGGKAGAGQRRAQSQRKYIFHIVYDSLS